MEKYNYFEPPAYSPPAPRTFQVDFTKWTGRHLQITESERLIYKADLTMRKPHMTFKTASDTTLSTVVFRSWKPHIEINLNGYDIDLKVKRGYAGYKQDTTYMSPSLNTPLSWKSKSCWKAFDFECLDEQGNVVAQFVPHNKLSMTKAGRVEVYGVRPDVVDEIVVVGVTLAYYTLVQVVNHAAA